MKRDLHGAIERSKAVPGRAKSWNISTTPR